jgi:hypothetical protein
MGSLLYRDLQQDVRHGAGVLDVRFGKRSGVPHLYE